MPEVKRPLSDIMANIRKEYMWECCNNSFHLRLVKLVNKKSSIPLDSLYNSLFLSIAIFDMHVCVFMRLEVGW